VSSRSSGARPAANPPVQPAETPIVPPPASAPQPEGDAADDSEEGTSN
jgi:hypothetical protein